MLSAQGLPEDRRRPKPQLVNASDVGAYFINADNPIDITSGQIKFSPVVHHQGYTSSQVADAIFTDDLTELPNRKSVPTNFNKAFQESKYLGEDRSLALIRFDLDNFKMINDQHGHQVGDLVLKALGRVFHRILRAGQIAARYGGEEFVFILPDIPTNRVKDILKKIHQDFTSEIAKEIPELNITASMGGAYVKCPPSEETPDELFRKLDNEADHLQYRAKVSGKNQIIFKDEN